MSPTTRTRAGSASRKKCARRWIFRSIARPSIRSCSTASSRRAISGSVRHIPTIRKHFRFAARDIAKAKALLKEAGVALPVAVDYMVPKGAENEAVAQVVQSMAAEAGFDIKIRVIEFATSLQAGPGRRIPGVPDQLERPDRSRRQFVRLPCTPRRRRTTAAIPIRKPTRLMDRRAADHRSRAAQGDLREADQDRAQRRTHHLHLSSQTPDRAYQEARGLPADAGRAGARGRAEAEVRAINPSPCPGRGAAFLRCSAEPEPGAWTRAQRC